MSKKRGTPGGAGGNSSNGGSRSGAGVKWYNPKPNNSDVEWLEGQAGEYGAWVVEFLENLQDGERITVKYDTHSQRWLGVLFIDPVSGRGDVHAVSVRASTGFLALVLLRYFVVVRFKDGFIEDGSPVSDKFG